jgi:hypothetical protein
MPSAAVPPAYFADSARLLRVDPASLATPDDMVASTLASQAASVPTAAAPYQVDDYVAAATTRRQCM